MSPTLSTHSILTSAAERRCDGCGSTIGPGDPLAWDAVVASISCGDCAAEGESTRSLILPEVRQRRKSTAPDPVAPPASQPFAPPVGLPAATTIAPPVGVPTAIAPPAPLVAASEPITPVDQPDDVDLTPQRSDLLEALVVAATEAVNEPDPTPPPCHSQTLRDRKIPRTRETIDRITVNAAGVLVIDDRPGSGRMALVETKRGMRLKLDGRDMTKSLRRARLACEAVEGALTLLGKRAIPVHRVLHFADASIADGSIEVDGITVVDSAGLDELLTARGTLPVQGIDRLADQLAERFGPQ